jgi:hypothetical protein
MNDQKTEANKDGASSGLALATGSVSPELEAAYANLVKAAQEYSKLAPQISKPTEPPKIEPTLLHADPGNFHRGYNMVLDSGGYMPGKVPVIVVPVRPEDLRRYSRCKTVNALRACLGISSPNSIIRPQRKA